MRLAMATHTPVPYWLGLPVAELGEWVEEVSVALREQTPRQ